MADEYKTAPFAPYEGTEPYIFISYAHADSDMVFPIITKLHKMGYRVWYDEGIDPGSEWPAVIERHLKHCEMCLLFITPVSITRRNVRKEINYADSLDKTIISIYMKPTSLVQGLQLTLSSYQSIFYYKYQNTSEFYDKLLRGLPAQFNIDPDSTVTYQAKALSAPGPQPEPQPTVEASPLKPAKQPEPPKVKTPKVKKVKAPRPKRSSKLKAFYMGKSKKGRVMMILAPVLVVLVCAGVTVNYFLQEKVRAAGADDYMSPAYIAGWDDDDEYDNDGTKTTFPATVPYKENKAYKAPDADAGLARMSSHKAHGEIAVDGEWVYYIFKGNYYFSAGLAEVGTLHRIKIDGTEDRRLSSTKITSFDIMDGWIYFLPESCPYYSNLEYYEKPLCRMTAEGYEEMSIADVSVKSFQLFDGMVYYEDSGRSNLYRMEPDGSDPVEIVSRGGEFFVTPDYLYYESDRVIYRCRLDGTKNADYYAAGAPVYALQSPGNDILFYRDEDYVIHAVRRKLGTSKRVAAPDVINSDFVMDNAWIYYVSASEKYSLYKIRLDGTRRTLVSDDTFDRIALFDDWLYFIGEGDNATDFSLYRMRTDGTGKELIKEMEVLRPAISTGY